MTLTLQIEGYDDLGNGMPTEFVLNRRGATIGRAPTCDWCLPDPQRYISSRHCEISFRDDAYWLTDVSTNGTYLNGSSDRLTGDHQIEQGDVLVVGRYTIQAQLSGMESDAEDNQRQFDNGPVSGPWDSSTEEPSASSAADEWGDPQTSGSGDGWESIVPRDNPTGRPPAAPSRDRSFEWGVSSSSEAPEQHGGWAPSFDASAIPHGGGSVWEGPEQRAEAASEWSSAAPDRPPAPKPTDIWGQIAEDNVVDWARSGFGAARNRAPDPLEEVSAPSFGPGSSAPPTTTTPPLARGGHQRAASRRTSPAPATPEPGRNIDADLTAFVRAAGLDPNALKASPSELPIRAGALVRSLVAGLYLLVEARARAKAQLGAESTRLEFDGNNPIKFARSPDEALAQLLNPPDRGFMDGERAVEDAFYDLQAHQMATLKAMQGALRATLDRFSPTAIRGRVDEGFLASILPAARDAALWQAYEREFSGVASGSDEAFMDVFAKEFRKAYDEQSRLARQSPAR